MAENGQNSSNENQKSDVNGNKDEKVAVGETPTWWTSTPKCKINITEFLENVKSFAHVVTSDGLLSNPEELKKVGKKIVSVFVVDKSSRKNCRSTKDTVIKALTSLSIKA